MSRLGIPWPLLGQPVCVCVCMYMYMYCSICICESVRWGGMGGGGGGGGASRKDCIKEMNRVYNITSSELHHFTSTVLH